MEFHNMESLYAVYDNQAKIIGRMCSVHRHDNSAIREFTDILSEVGTMPNKHPDNYELICLAEVHHGDNSDGPVIRAAYRVVLTGKQWRDHPETQATQQRLKEEAADNLRIQQEAAAYGAARAAADEHRERGKPHKLAQLYDKFIRGR